MISCWEYGRPNHSTETVAVLAIIVRVIAIMLVIVIVYNNNRSNANRKHGSKKELLSEANPEGPSTQ